MVATLIRITKPFPEETRRIRICVASHVKGCVTCHRLAAEDRTPVDEPDQQKGCFDDIWRLYRVVMRAEHRHHRRQDRKAA